MVDEEAYGETLQVAALGETCRPWCVANHQRAPVSATRQGQTLPTAGGDVVLSWASQWPCGEARATITLEAPTL